MADIRDAGRQVAGEVAHDLPVVSKPIIIGAYASSSAPSNVSADADAVYLWALRNGALCVNVASGVGAVATGATPSGSDLGIPLLAKNDDDSIFQPLFVNSSGQLLVSVQSGAPIQYVVDSALGVNPSGNLCIAIRDDVLSSLTPVEGDAVGLRVDANGALWAAISGSVAVTNTGTFAVQAAQSGTWNIGTVTAVTAISNALPSGTNNIGDVDVLTVPADPFGANADAASATGSISAKLRFIASTGIPITGTVTVGSHAVTNAGTFAVQVDGNALTALQLIDDPVATLGTTTYTETTTKGFIIAAVRRDADTTLVDTTNELSPLQVDANGRLKVEAFDSGDSHTVDNNGTFVVQENGAALTALQLIDDVVYTDDTSTHSTGTSKGVGIMAAAVPTDASVNANDIGMVAMTTDRKLHVAVMDALPAGTAAIGKLAANSGVDIGDVDVTTCGTITPGTGASNLGKAESSNHTSADVGVFALAVSNEANTSRSSDGQYTPIAVDTEGNVRTVGNRDHDAVDAGEVVGIGGRAIAHGTNPTAVAAADRTAWYFNRAGVPFMIGGHPNVKTHSVRVLDSDGAQTNAAIVTVSAGTKIVVTRVSIKADGSNTGPINCTVGFGTSTLTTPNTTTAGTGILADFQGVPAGGGCVEGNGAGILGVGADDEDLRFSCEDPVGGALTISVSYYTIES